MLRTHMTLVVDRVLVIKNQSRLLEFFSLVTVSTIKETEKKDFVIHCYSVNWCFEPSHPLGIISGMNDAFIKRYII